MVTESGLILIPSEKYSFRFESVAGSCKGCPANDSCSNYLGGRKTVLKVSSLIPQPDHHWWCKPARQRAVSWSNKADVFTCQSFETFSIDLLFGCCQTSFTSGKHPKDPDATEERKGKNQQNWALNSSVGALKGFFFSLSIKRKINPVPVKVSVDNTPIHQKGTELTKNKSI